MGNVHGTVKHCLSYEQLLQDYPWLRRWPLEEKVGVVFLVSNLQHMLCHMTLPWQRGCTASQDLLTAEASYCLYNWSLLVKSCSAFTQHWVLFSNSGLQGYIVTPLLLSNKMQMLLWRLVSLQTAQLIAVLSIEMLAS